LYSSDLDLALFELFAGKEELMPVWLVLRSEIESLGEDVRLSVRERYAEFDRRGSLFVLAEPTSDHHLELGLHNPGLPYDERFRPGEGWGPKRITHRTSVPEDAAIDPELHARLHDAYALALEGEPR
jgi:hypothetical protein